jgi:exosome complex RNA-binding protein Rrp4
MKTNQASAVEMLSIVLPGDDVTDKIRQTTPKPPKLGTGLRTSNGINSRNGNSNHDDNVRILSTCAGRLVQRSNTYYVKQNIQRYRPLLEDRVIGIVEDRVASDGSGGDIYRVNIGGPHPVSMPTKRMAGLFNLRF